MLKVANIVQHNAVKFLWENTFGDNEIFTSITLKLSVKLYPCLRVYDVSFKMSYTGIAAFCCTVLP